jgi:tetratricopeptide (TPR) repeat protein
MAWAADPGNQDVIDKMLLMWENNPDKREQVATIYGTMLDRNPSDRVLEKKLADLFWDLGRKEDAIRHYLKLYQASDQWRNTPLEERLVTGLDDLHRLYAREKKYDQAIIYYKLLAAIDPRTDPTAVITYEYLKRAAALKPDDLAGKLALAQFAENSGLDSDALAAYRQLLEPETTKKDAQEGIDRYARKSLATSQAFFQSGDFYMARTLAQKAQQDYPNSQEVQTALAEIIGKCMAEIAKIQRSNRETAERVIKRGDEFYNQAMTHFNNLFDLQRANIPNLYSPREEAKRYFVLAIQAYQEALRIDPALGTETQSLVNVRLKECQDNYTRLTMPLPPPRYRVINIPGPTGNF